MDDLRMYSIAAHDQFEFENHLLIIPRSEPRLLILNPTACAVWQGLVDGIEPAGVAAQLAARHGVPLSRVRADVDAIIAQWLDDQVIVDPRLPTSTSTADPATDRTFDRGGEHHWRKPMSTIEHDYDLCGHAVRLRFDGRHTEDLVHPPLAHTEVVDAAPDAVIELMHDGRDYLVMSDGAGLGRYHDSEEALAQVFDRLLAASYPEAEWLAVMHAAAVGDGGGAVVLPAESGSGKSTLTAALVHAGLQYFSDDQVPLDASLHVRPMPLGIGIKEGSWSVLAARYPEVAALPTHYDWRPRRFLPVPTERRGPSAGLPVVAVVFPRYRPYAPSSLTELTPLQVLTRLTKARAWMSLDRQRFPKALDWLRSTPGHEVVYRSLDDALPVVQGLLRGNTASPAAGRGEP